MKKVNILETTLRDGSYAVDFKFTAKDTANIAYALEQCGFEWIEIGHGLGLNAREIGKGDAACSDREYLEAAASVLKKAKFGVFCIPGIARLEDIDMAASYGISFIRIGTNITELEGSNRYFERAKKYNLFVSANLMKSYAVPPKDFGKYVKLAKEYGADIVVLVDSAGGLLPKDVEEYFKCAQDACDIPLGFHGHNNLGLANANTIKAVEMGALMVDTSLKGLGRSAGNAATEMIVLLLKKLGYELDINEFAVMDVAEKYITPLLYDLKHTPISVILGYAQFHSSYLGTIFKYAQKYNIDPRELIIKVAERDKVNAPDDLVEQLSREISREKNKITSRSIALPAFKFYLKAVNEKNPEKQIEIIIEEIIAESKKKGKKSVLNIVLSDIDKNENFVSQFIQESSLFIVGSVETSYYEYIKKLLPYIDGKIDYILLDSSIKRKGDKELILSLKNDFKKTTVLLYNDLLVWANSIVSLLSNILYDLINKPIAIYGNNRLAKYIAEQTKCLGAVVRMFDPQKLSKSFYKQKTKLLDTFFEKCNVIISCSRYYKLNREFIGKFRKVNIIIDAKINTLEPDVIKYANEFGMKLIRPDMRAAIAGEILHQISIYNLVKNDLGRKAINNYSIISGGLIGKEGEIVVDSISSPSRVIGVAKGNGEVIYNPEDEKYYKILQEVQLYIDTFK
jgi:4-hydroxy 2-oxovalerate aldolase/long-chain acyl-CoA synthetase